MKKNSKGIIIAGLLIICALLTTGLFLLGQSPKGEDDLQNTGEPAGDVTTPQISGSEIQTSEPPAINPPAITSSPDIQTVNDIPLTVIDDKPEPPELPDNAYTGEQTGDATPEDVEAHEAIDPALKNPDVKPDTTPAPVEPTKPKETTPQSGDKKDGQIYIPGFGWVTDEGGGAVIGDSGSDGDWDKIIGH